jgi:uncharacterized protein
MRNWFIKRVPDRHALAGNRWLAPVASRLATPAIWHFNRRTIARGVALGLFAGFILPIGQVALAVLFAASVRANILVASAATLVTNPLTFAPIYDAAYRTGSVLLALSGLESASSSEAPSSLLISLIAASLPTMVGLICFAVLSSILAFVAVNVAWRIALMSKWRRRRGG